MTNKDRIEFVHDRIKAALKDCAFTFDDLKVETDPDRWASGSYRERIKVTFEFNDFGNNQQTLGNNQPQ